MLVIPFLLEEKFVRQKIYLECLNFFMAGQQGEFYILPNIKDYFDINRQNQ